MDRIKFHLTTLLKSKKYKGRKDKILEYLANCAELDDDRKNLIYFTIFPRQLLDGEFPSRLLSSRTDGNTVGYLEPNIREIGLLLEASLTDQYKNFLRHLLHSFRDPSQVFPLQGTEKCECCICRKGIWAYDAWDNICKQYPSNPEKDRKEYLAFASDNTTLTICLDCLIQLSGLDRLMKVLDGDNYLDWRVNQWDRLIKPSRINEPAGMDNPNANLVD